MTTINYAGPREPRFFFVFISVPALEIALIGKSKLKSCHNNSTSKVQVQLTLEYVLCNLKRRRFYLDIHVERSFKSSRKQTFISKKDYVDKY